MNNIYNIFNKKPVAIFTLIIVGLSLGVLIVHAALTISTQSVVSDNALNLSAGGTNQNVVVTPSGTGFTVLNGNVGIGTNAPANLLSVNGNIQITSSTAGLIFGDGTVQTTAATGNASLWTSTSTGIFYNGGKVGIGTVSPSQALDINGNLNVNGNATDTPVAMFKPNNTGTAINVSLAGIDKGGAVLSMPAVDTSVSGFSITRSDQGVWAGERDPMMFFGYNLNTDGGFDPKISGMPVLAYGMEGNYWDQPAARHWIETYTQFLGTNGTTILRPFGVGINYDTNTSGVTVATNDFVIADVNIPSEPIFEIAPAWSSNQPWTAGVTLHHGQFYIGSYGAPIQFANHDKSAYINGIGLDPYNTFGYDQLYLGMPYTNATETPVYISGKLSLYNQNAAHSPLTIQGVASQTAHLQNWQNNFGAVLASVDNAGNITVATSTAGLVLTSPDGTCWRLSVANTTGALSTASTTCP
jgi:hypothetical protein